MRKIADLLSPKNATISVEKNSCCQGGQETWHPSHSQ